MLIFSSRFMFRYVFGASWSVFEILSQNSVCFSSVKMVPPDSSVNLPIFAIMVPTNTENYIEISVFTQ